MTAPLEQLWGGFLRGPLTAPKSLSGGYSPFAGLADVSSGDASVVISTPHVKSDSLIITGLFNMTAAGSGTPAFNVVVTSRNPGNGFVLARHDGQSIFTVGSGQVGWFLINLS